jgi:hypothetical protein
MTRQIAPRQRAGNDAGQSGPATIPARCWPRLVSLFGRAWMCPGAAARSYSVEFEGDF